MPESVTDRPTKAHEQIFLLAKSESRLEYGPLPSRLILKRFETF
jgi:hypothetical protein